LHTEALVFPNLIQKDLIPRNHSKDALSIHKLFTMSDSSNSEETDEGSVSTWPRVKGRLIAKYTVLWEDWKGVGRDDILGDQGNSFTFKFDEAEAPNDPLTDRHHKLFFQYEGGNASYSCVEWADETRFLVWRLLKADNKMKEAVCLNLESLEIHFPEQSS
jgi:hypothetical protein